MLEQIQTTLDQLLADQRAANDKLSTHLLKEIDLRKQDQLKIVQLERTVTELKTEMNTAFAGSREKLDQLQHSFRSHEEKVLAEMNTQLKELQDKICASALTIIEQDSQTKVTKRVAAPDATHNVEPKLPRPNIDPGMFEPGPSGINCTTTTTKNNGTNTPMGVDISETNGAQTSNIISTSNSESPVTKSCYENWDNRSIKLKNAKFVQYQELRTILEKVTVTYGAGTNLNPEYMTDARLSIKALEGLTVNKYERFPSTGTYINVNIFAKSNTELKKIYYEPGIYNFYAAVCNYLNVIPDSTVDQGLFEKIYALKWAPEIINLE